MNERACFHAVAVWEKSAFDFAIPRRAWLRAVGFCARRAFDAGQFSAAEAGCAPVSGRVSRSNVDKIVCKALGLLAACLISSLALAGLLGAVARLVRLVNDEVVLMAVAHLRMWALLDVEYACRLLFLDEGLVI